MQVDLSYAKMLIYLLYQIWLQKNGFDKLEKSDKISKNLYNKTKNQKYHEK